MRVLFAIVTLVTIVLGVFTLGAFGPRGFAGLAALASPADVRLEAEKPAKRLVIGLDLSRSNPLISDKAFARKVGERVSALIAAAGFASEVHVRTFGSYSAAANTFAYDVMISVRQRPEDVAAKVGQLIADTPALVRKGTWQAQDKTNILAFLDNVSNSLGCANLPTTIVLVSDGMEDSEYAHLARRNSELPAPDGAPFKGCAELLILGLGQGQPSPEKTTHLRGEWSRWANAAGFAAFIGLNDW